MAKGKVNPIRTKPPTKEYHEGWDHIFGKKKKKAKKSKNLSKK